MRPPPGGRMCMCMPQSADADRGLAEAPMKQVHLTAMADRVLQRLINAAQFPAGVLEDTVAMAKLRRVPA